MCSPALWLYLQHVWDGAGKDLITDSSCKEPYEWKDKTGGEWEFSTTIPNGDAEKFHVSLGKDHA